jgi:Uma2 family endonuclease
MSMPPQDAAARRIKLGWEELLELPEDGNRYEILDGELVMTPPPAICHQVVLRNLTTRLHEHVTANSLGTVLFAPVAVRLDETTIAEPDLIFVTADRASIIRELSIDAAPNLVVEILSPSTAKRDRTVKAQLYARLGVDHYWIVDPKARGLEAFERDRDAYREGVIVEGEATFEPTLFPGLRVELSALWA